MTKSLRELLKQAESAQPSAPEQEEQRRSFAFGNANIENKHVTRDVINQQASETPAPQDEGTNDEPKG